MHLIMRERLSYAWDAKGPPQMYEFAEQQKQICDSFTRALSLALARSSRFARMLTLTVTFIKLVVAVVVVLVVVVLLLVLLFLFVAVALELYHCYCSFSWSSSASSSAVAYELNSTL